MITKTKDSLKWLEFELFQDLKALSHAIFLRSGGTSLPPYDSLNMGFSTDDNQECLKKNIDKALSVFKASRYQRGRLVHGNTVLEASDAKEALSDGLMTSEKDLALIITHADCQAAILYDPIHHALSAVHAGWRGQKANIYKEAVQAMQRRYGSKPQDLLVGVSPSLGPKHAEFKDWETLLPASFAKFRIGACHFDFWAVAEDQFLELGILKHHLEIAKICTFEEKDSFFSHRRDKITGRNATFAALR